MGPREEVKEENRLMVPGPIEAEPPRWEDGCAMVPTGGGVGTGPTRSWADEDGVENEVEDDNLVLLPRWVKGLTA